MRQMKSPPKSHFAKMEDGKTDSMMAPQRNDCKCCISPIGIHRCAAASQLKNP